VIDQHHFGAAVAHCSGDFIRLAATGEKTRVGPAAPAFNETDDVQSGRFRQALKLLGAFCVIRDIEIEGNEQRAFAARRTFKQGDLP
jgi:hypothetical protein